MKVEEADPDRYGAALAATAAATVGASLFGFGERHTWHNALMLPSSGAIFKFMPALAPTSGVKFKAHLVLCAKRPSTLRRNRSAILFV